MLSVDRVIFHSAARVSVSVCGRDCAHSCWCWACAWQAEVRGVGRAALRVGRVGELRGPRVASYAFTWAHFETYLRTSTSNLRSLSLQTIVSSLYYSNLSGLTWLLLGTVWSEINPFWLCRGNFRSVKEGYQFESRHVPIVIGSNWLVRSWDNAYILHSHHVRVFFVNLLPYRKTTHLQRRCTLVNQFFLWCIDAGFICNLATDRHLEVKSGSLYLVQFFYLLFLFCNFNNKWSPYVSAIAHDATSVCNASSLKQTARPDHGKLFVTRISYMR